MKKLLLGITFLVFISSSLYALEDGKYVGLNVKSNRKCSVEVMFDGDYMKSGGVNYRLTIQTPNKPNGYCKDYDETSFENCGSGSNENTERTLYIYGVGDNLIEKIEFNNEDFDSTNDKVCINLKRLGM